LDELEMVLRGGVEDEERAPAVGLETTQMTRGAAHLARDV